MRVAEKGRLDHDYDGYENEEFTTDGAGDEDSDREKTLNSERQNRSYTSAVSFRRAGSWDAWGARIDAATYMYLMLCALMHRSWPMSLPLWPTFLCLSTIQRR